MRSGIVLLKRLKSGQNMYDFFKAVIVGVNLTYSTRGTHFWHVDIRFAEFGNLFRSHVGSGLPIVGLTFRLLSVWTV